METRRVTKRTLLASLVVAPLLAASAGSAAASVSSAPTSGVEHVREEVRPAGSGADALTYAPSLVPVGARLAVLTVPSPAGTTTVLGAAGLRPEREYGAHVHTDPCGPAGEDAGPHFQHVPDPDPSTADPAYANPHNEIWLDFTTDADGTGTALSRVDWRIGDRQAASVVIHERHTSTEPGSAGQAGRRVACVNVPFGTDG